MAGEHKKSARIHPKASSDKPPTNRSPSQPPRFTLDSFCAWLDQKERLVAIGLELLNNLDDPDDSPDPISLLAELLQALFALTQNYQYYAKLGFFGPQNQIAKLNNADYAFANNIHRRITRILKYPQNFTFEAYKSLYKTSNELDQKIAECLPEVEVAPAETKETNEGASAADSKNSEVITDNAFAILLQALKDAVDYLLGDINRRFFKRTAPPEYVFPIDISLLPTTTYYPAPTSKPKRAPTPKPKRSNVLVNSARAKQSLFPVSNPPAEQRMSEDHKLNKPLAPKTAPAKTARDTDRLLGQQKKYSEEAPKDTTENDLKGGGCCPF